MGRSSIEGSEAPIKGLSAGGVRGTPVIDLVWSSGSAREINVARTLLSVLWCASRGEVGRPIDRTVWCFLGVSRAREEIVCVGGGRGKQPWEGGSELRSVVGGE